MKIHEYQARENFERHGVPMAAARIAREPDEAGDAFRGAARTIHGMARAFRHSDASLAEINPLVQTDEGGIVAVDAKMVIDDNARNRHRGLGEGGILAETIGSRTIGPTRNAVPPGRGAAMFRWAGISAVWSTARAC